MRCQISPRTYAIWRDAIARFGLKCLACPGSALVPAAWLRVPMLFSGRSTPIEKAQSIAARELPRTTKLYDRTSDDISLTEIERIVI